jgi:capsular polysaccharide transport system permease protein
MLFIGLPTALAAFYYGVLASDMYISEAHFSVRSPEGGGGTDFLSLFGQTAGSAVADAHVVQDHILSADMLQLLEKRFSLRNHYNDSGADFISRLATDATAEEFLDYYRDVISVGFDTTTGIVSLKVRAYTPEMARNLAQAILEESEKVVNSLNERSQQDSLAMAHNELTRAEKRLAAAREALRQLRHKTELINPESTAGSVHNLVSGLEAEAAKVRADLSAARTYMSENSIQVVALKTRAQALDRQVAAEKARLTGSGGGALNEVVSEFEQATVEHDFAQKQYQTALAALETARIHAESKNRYLVAYAKPTLPEESRYPLRLLFSGLALVSFSLIYGIFALAIATIREHVGS